MISSTSPHQHKCSSRSKALLKSGMVPVFILLVVLLSIVNLMNDSTEFRTLDRRSIHSADILSSQQQLLLDQTFPKNNKSLDVIMKRTNQVLMVMPPKAAGTTMSAFTYKCTGIEVPNDFLRTQKISKIVNTYDLPSIISAHLYGDQHFIRIVKGATRETLVFYIHREELPRLRSAIQQVVMSKICVDHHTKGLRLKKKYDFDVEKKGNRCIIDEKHLISIIKGRENEIGFGTSDILTCNSFDAIAQNTPSNLVFVNYKQANKLQKILAKYHCPQLVKNLPISLNVAAHKRIEPFVRLETDNSTKVTLEEWFDKKQNLILWALDLKRTTDCQSKIMDMEDHLFLCPDEAVTFFRGEFQCVSLSDE